MISDKQIESIVDRVVKNKMSGSIDLKKNQWVIPTNNEKRIFKKLK